MDARFEFWRRWLVVATCAVMALGAAMVVLPQPVQQFFNLVLSGTAAPPSFLGPDAVHYVTFVYAVLGAVMFGWGALLLMVLRGPFRRGDRDAWWMVAVSVALWFVPDTVYSLWSGYWQNAVLNLGFGVAFGAGLVGAVGVWSRGTDAPATPTR
jgi:hypothetical protein